MIHAGFGLAILGMTLAGTPRPPVITAVKLAEKGGFRDDALSCIHWCGPCCCMDDRSPKRIQEIDDEEEDDLDCRCDGRSGNGRNSPQAP